MKVLEPIGSFTGSPLDNLNQSLAGAPKASRKAAHGVRFAASSCWLPLGPMLCPACGNVLIHNNLEVAVIQTAATVVRLR
jgi:hypothetical protein